MRAGLRLGLAILAAGLALGQAPALAQSNSAATTNTPPARDDRAARASEFQPSGNGHQACGAACGAAIDERSRAATCAHRAGPASRVRPGPQRADEAAIAFAFELVDRLLRPRSPRPARGILDAIGRFAARDVGSRAARARVRPAAAKPRSGAHGRGAANVRLADAGGRRSAAARRCCCGAAVPAPHSRTDPNSNIFRRPSRSPRLRLRHSPRMFRSAWLPRADHSPRAAAARGQADRRRIVALEALDRPQFHPARLRHRSRPRRDSFRHRDVQFGQRAARDLLVEVSLFNAGPTQEQDIAAFFANPAGPGERIPGIVPLKSLPIRNSIVVARSNIQMVELGGNQVYVPVVAFNVHYRGNRRRRPDVSELSGRPRHRRRQARSASTGSKPRQITGLGVRPLPIAVRR